MKIQADVWLSSEDTDEYWAEGVKASVEVETTDADEVRIGVTLAGDGTDAATLYVSRDSADKLARFLAAASVADVRTVVGG